MKESLREAAARELEEETGVKGMRLEQLYTFGEVERDPRTRIPKSITLDSNTSNSTCFLSSLALQINVTVLSLKFFIVRVDCNPLSNT